MPKLCQGCNKITKVKGKVCGKDPIHECMECGYREHAQEIIMKLLGFEITKLEDKPDKKTVSCYHCGKQFETGVNNIRTYNYCSSC